MSKPVLFIDGEAGTTGLEIRNRLAGRNDLHIVSIDPDKRKDPSERQKILNSCDVTILCLPDAAAKEAVSLITNPAVRVIDASTAYRVAEGWCYGFPELCLGQEELIRTSKRVSNPGCYPTGTLALVRPLVDAKLLSVDYQLTVNAISGYSGGGKELINLCENPQTKGKGRAGAFCLYGLDQQHKHLPEMRVHGRLNSEPIFLPSYSSAFYKGMLVHIELHLNQLDGVLAKDIHEALAKRYINQKYILVEPMQEKLEPGTVLSPLDQNDTNNVQLRVFSNPEKGSVVLTAVLDNLGKGASGAAVQNLDLMLGL
jgi:N-acetyl-gamma-glutamyl-phosphate reductase